MLRDEVDRQIVASLQADARSSFTEIGALVGLSAPAVKRRVDRLMEDGVILGFTAVVDDEALGAGTEAFIELFCRGRTNPDGIREMVDRHPEVVAAYTVTGEADALVHVRTATMSDLESVLERIHAHKNTERTRSVVVLSRLIDRSVMPATVEE